METSATSPEHQGRLGACSRQGATLLCSDAQTIAQLRRLLGCRSNFGQISGMLPDLPPPGQMRFTMGAYQPLQPSRRLRARRPSIFQRPPNPRRDNRFRGSTGM